jgi:hypothetical protein
MATLYAKSANHCLMKYQTMHSPRFTLYAGYVKSNYELLEALRKEYDPDHESRKIIYTNRQCTNLDIKSIGKNE